MRLPFVNFLLLCFAISTGGVISDKSELPSTSSAPQTSTARHCEREIKLFALPIGKGSQRIGITHYHEGAGIDYLFLTGADSPKYIYNKCTHQIYIMINETYKQFLNEVNGLVQLTVSGPAGDFVVQKVGDRKQLSVNGQINGWQGCKNTNDPYNYSKNLYQLVFTGHTFSECIPIIVEVE